ncbi:TonB-dependent receptor plug domain-containing protein [Janthinobacterium fluminis]|uniref:TonB-dependent receptor n=1 Tax=Janthinobacterium fluminis TaxID=2987524 RepID=A0ABT5K8D3_9BURK|nr:TonB-dependent receptor [Janthinobacterium fluminis]MDC8760017.1 TonB-dependent receptor [Janthinobacterium fluminis]
MPYRYFSARLTLAAAAVLTAWSAQAQQAPGAIQPEAPAVPLAPQPAPQPAAAPAMQQVEVRGSSASYDPRRDDTASKIVVGSEEILRYGDTSVMDVFKRLPGVTVAGGAIRMRGLGSYTQILLNGERAPAGFSIDTLAPDLIERIEIMRAASAEFSTQAIAGTINIVLKKAVKARQREAKLSLAEGGVYQTAYGNVQLSDRDGGFSYSLSGGGYRNHYDQTSRTVESGDAPDGTPTLLRRDTGRGVGRNDGINVAPRLNWALANGDTLTWQSFLNVNRSQGRSDDQADTVLGRAATYGREEQRRHNHSGFGRSDLSWVHKLAGGARLDLKIGGQLSRSTVDTHNLGWHDDGGAVTLERRVATVSTEKGFSSTGKYATPLAEGHALALGWDGGSSTRDDTRRQRERDLPGSTPVNSDEGFTATVRRLALYGQDEWTITPRWSVYAGLRWEGLDTRSDSQAYDSVQQRSSVWSPLLQTLLKLPNGKDQLRFALTRTYKAPSTSSLIPRRFTSNNNSQNEPDRRGNPNLKPELALGLDGSYEHYWADGALLSASASVRRIDGYTRQGLVLENGRWLSLPVNDGRALSRSIELEAKFPLSALVAGAPAVDLRASVSRNWSRVDAVPGPDNRLDQQTPLSVVAGLDYKGAGGVFSAGGSFIFKNGGPVRIGEHERAYAQVRRDLDIYALWKFDAKQQLRVALLNLLGQDDYSRSSYTDVDGTQTRATATPGRTQVRATLEIKF